MRKEPWNEGGAATAWEPRSGGEASDFPPPFGCAGEVAPSRNAAPGVL